ncbi:MAG: VOC family protein [Sneathiella sp.]
MAQHFAAFSLLVKDYDEAISYYTEILDFELIEDTTLAPGKRWVLVAPPGAKETKMLLAKANGDAQQKALGNQTGGRVGFFLNTTDFWTDFERMKTKGVKFLEEPREESYATVVVFEDLYGNRWDFLQPKNMS